MTGSSRNLRGQFFRRVGPDFRKGRMIMWHHGQRLNGHSPGHGGDDFMDEFSAGRADTSTAENPARSGVGQQFYEAVPGLHDQRFAVIVKRITRGEEFDITRSG